VHRPADDALVLKPRTEPVPYALPTTEKKPRRLVLWPFVLLAITAGGTFLRFYRLTFPALWNDETLVYWRVCGSYGEMLRPLTTDGFPPLHYSFYWLLGNLDKAAWVPWTWPAVWILAGITGLVGAWIFRRVLGRAGPILASTFAAIAAVFAVLQFRLIHLAWTWFDAWAAGHGAWTQATIHLLTRHSFDPALPAVHWFSIAWAARHIKLTPFVMRAPVAACGALTVPAIYFLARQMVDRRTSLVAAAFTACSAFMLFYSRDAKMYADVWLFEVLFVACLLWWLNKGGSTRFLCWVASGCAMVGLHASALAVFAPVIVMLFTAGRVTFNTGLKFSAGIFIVFIGLYGYTTKFNKWVDRAETDAVDLSGIAWVDKFYNGDRKGPDLALYATSTFLNGWEWPRDDYLDKFKPYDPNGVVHRKGQTAWMPDPVTRLRDQPIREAYLVGPQTAFEVSALLVAIGIIPWPRRVRSPELPSDPPGDARWRTLLWIGVWIMVIGYGFYSVSVKEFSPPGEWRDWAIDYITPAGTALVIGVIAAFVAVSAFHRRWWRGLRRFAASTVVVAVICFVIWGMYKLMTPFARAAEAAGNPLPMAWLPRYMGVIWPAFSIAVAVLLMRLPTRPFRTAAIAFLLMVNLGIFGMRMTLGTEPPIDKLCDDEWASQDPKATVRCYNGIDIPGSRDIAVAGTTMVSWPAGNVDGITVTGGRYYMQMLGNRSPMSPRIFNGPIPDPFDPARRYNLREYMSPAQVMYDLKRAPQVKTVILWTRTWPTQNPTDPPMSIGGERYDFGPQWRLAPGGEQTFTVRIPWEWRERCTWIRREYTRVETKR
jgi:hypothetical protein